MSKKVLLCTKCEYVHPEEFNCSFKSNSERIPTAPPLPDLKTEEMTEKKTELIINNIINSNITVNSNNSDNQCSNTENICIYLKYVLIPTSFLVLVLSYYLYNEVTNRYSILEKVIICFIS